MRLYSKLFALFLLCIAYSAQAQQSFNITFPHDGKTVYGTFTVPAGTGKFPTIIIAPGSGANDRNGTLPMVGGNVSCLYPALLNDTLRPYRQLADSLVAGGFAVLRYDKLEYTYPTNLGAVTFHKLWLPVESALTYVKTRNDVDTNRLILIGHSEGSSLIPHIAKSRDDIRALISIGGPRTPFDSILAYQLVYFAQTCGGNVALAQSQSNQILAYYNAIRTGNWNGSTPALFGVPAAAWSDYLEAIDSVAANYRANDVPTLFVGMDLDVNVPPAEINRFENEVPEADFYRLPGLIHYMTPLNNPNVSKVLTDTILYWLREHNLVTAAPSVSKPELQVNIFPNPFTDAVSIHMPPGFSGRFNCTVRNALGQICFNRAYKQPGDAIQIDLHTLSRGVYFIEIESAEGSACKRIVRE